MGEAALAYPATEGPAPPSAPRTLGERVARIRPPSFWPAVAGKAPLSPIERAGLIRLTDSIPGDCGDEKLVALMEAMRHAPAGDVVEIGSGGGRTAAALVWLARRYQVGAVLCLDAWSEAQLADFEIDVAPLADGRLNYLALDPAPAYAPELAVATPAFGETRYAGRIALLHLARDADADAAAWTAHVVAGGWIVFAGPAAAEAFAAAHGPRIGASFAAGGARFVQLKRKAAN
ncbi:MAG TPA: hypothetical protein VGG29_09070 [Caulobacteraceae bacterium]|jgi:hypothetical protein